MNIRTLAREALALLITGGVILLGLALFSFSARDPSMNQQTQAQAANLTGLVGAYVADFMYQLFGYAAWLWAILMLAMACRMAWDRRPFSGGWTSLFWLPVALSAAALLHVHAAADMFVLPAGPGGALGGMLAGVLNAPLNELGRDVLLCTLLLSSLVAASHWSVLRLIGKCYDLLLNMWRWVERGLAFLRARASLRKEQIEQQDARLKAREVRKKIRKKRPTHIAESAAEVVEPARVKVSRRAKEAQQVELAFRDQAAGYQLPSLQMFDHGAGKRRKFHPEALQAMSRMLEKKLLDYRIEGKVVAVQPGPVVTQFEFEPAAGTKVNRIVALQDDLARSMAAISVRVSGNIPGKNVIGIEIPNAEREDVTLYTVLSSKEFESKRRILPMALGVDIAGRPMVADLARMPHLLVAGTTGSGKSVAVNSMICSLLMVHTPQSLRMILVDPKMLELSIYDDIPHLLTPVVTSPHKAARALAWAVYEMDRRYQLMSEARVRNIDGYNKFAAKQEGAEHVPFIVIVIDELADLMMVAGKEVEQSICRIAQKARAAGLHLILATQRPSVDVITGLIKANLPSRLSFQVSSRIDSRTIIDQMGAEQLLGKGDSLLLSGGRDLRRIHGAFVSDGEVLDLVEHLKEQGEPDYHEEVFEPPPQAPDAEGLAATGEAGDEKYDEAAALVIEKGQCSVSMVQRYLRIGYNRASRLVEQMEREGLVTPPGAGGMRKVLARSNADGGGVIE